MNTRELSRGGLLAALLSAGLWIVNLLPTGQLAGLMVLSFLPGIYLRRGRKRPVALACLASVLVGYLLGVQMGVFALYAAYFAWYALLWVMTEKKALGRLWRYLAAQVSLAATACVYAALGGRIQGLWMYLFAGEAAVIVYDFIFGFCVKFYDERLSGLFSRI